MAVNVIDTIKPKNQGSFPVVEAVDVKVTDEKRLDAALNDKADASDLSALAETVAGKASSADLAELTETVNGKAEQTDLEELSSALTEKADQSDLVALEAVVEEKADASDVTTAAANLQAQIDEIITPVTQDAEVQNARVDSDGVSYQTLKARIDNLETSIRSDICEIYNQTNSYSQGQVVVKGGVIYKAKVDIPAGETWTAGHWEQRTVSQLIDEKILGTNNNIAELYDATSTYKSGDIVNYNNVTYIAKNDIPVAEAWVSGHWTRITLAERIENDSDRLFDRYSTTTEYAVGDYTIHNDKLYVCRIATASGGEAWTAGHWTLISSSAFSIISEIQRILNTVSAAMPSHASANNKLATMQDVTSMQQYKSWEVKKEKLTNTEYKELLLDINTISERESLYAAKDYSVRFQDLPFTIKQITNSTLSSTPFRIAVNTPFKLLGVQEIDVYYYIEDATKITEVRLKALESSATKSVYSFRNGWNKLRFFMEGAGNYDADANTQTLEIRTYTTNEVTVWIGGVIVVKPQYANVIIIDDGPYYSFYTEAYPTLKANNIPVTWAVDALQLDAAGAVNRSLINMNELELLAIDGLSEFSFHSYDGSTMSSATANEALSDTLNSIRFLRRNGLQPNKIWRAAWMQNSCAYPELANLELDASASYNGAAGVVAYPFPDKYNIPRVSIQNRNEEWFDDVFEKLRRQHCTVLFYTHGVSENSDKDITHEMLTYFIGKITAATEAGYLNCTTYNRLINLYHES